jgi:light-harvesting protein B-800-850 beta chain
MSTRNDTVKLEQAKKARVVCSSEPGRANVVTLSVIKPRRREHGGTFMSNDPDKVWPTGLTLREAEEVHSYLIDGTRVFGVIALIAHILVAVSTPWLG